MMPPHSEVEVDVYLASVHMNRIDLSRVPTDFPKSNSMIFPWFFQSLSRKFQDAKYVEASSSNRAIVA